MSNPASAYSESLLTDTTPVGFQSPTAQTQGKAESNCCVLFLNKELPTTGIRERNEQQNKSVWNVLGNAMGEREEMKLRICTLESSDENLKSEVEIMKNQLENMSLNNAQLVDEVEKMQFENAELRKMLNEIKTDQINQQRKMLSIEWSLCMLGVGCLLLTRRKWTSFSFDPYLY